MVGIPRLFSSSSCQSGSAPVPNTYVEADLPRVLWHGDVRAQDRVELRVKGSFMSCPRHAGWVAALRAVRVTAATTATAASSLTPSFSANVRRLLAERGITTSIRVQRNVNHY